MSYMKDLYEQITVHYFLFTNYFYNYFVTKSSALRMLSAEWAVAEWLSVA